MADLENNNQPVELVYFSPEELRFYTEEDVAIWGVNTEGMKVFPRAHYETHWRDRNIQTDAQGYPHIAPESPSTYHEWNKEKLQWEISEEGKGRLLQDKKEALKQFGNQEIEYRVNEILTNAALYAIKQDLKQEGLSIAKGELESYLKFLRKGNKDGIKIAAYLLGVEWENLTATLEKVEFLLLVAPLAARVLTNRVAKVVAESESIEEVEGLNKFILEDFLNLANGFSKSLDICKSLVDEAGKQAGIVLKTK